MANSSWHAPGVELLQSIASCPARPVQSSAEDRLIQRSNGLARQADRLSLANFSAPACGAVPWRILAHPALVRRFAGQLISRIGRDSQPVRAIVHSAMNDIHAEDHNIAGVVFGGQPAPSQFLTNMIWIFR